MEGRKFGSVVVYSKVVKSSNLSSSAAVWFSSIIKQSNSVVISGRNLRAQGVWLNPNFLEAIPFCSIEE